MKRNVVLGGVAVGLVAAVAAVATRAATRGETPTRAEAATHAEAAGTMPQPAAPSAPRRGDDPFGGLDLGALGAKIAAEKAAAGQSTTSAAKVFRAIEGELGLPLEGRLQVYGGSVGARYCERANTSSEVYVVVCEFEGDAAATKGVAAGSTKAIPRREVLRARDATIAIHRAGTSDRTEADATRIRALVTKLRGGA